MDLLGEKTLGTFSVKKPDSGCSTLRGDQSSTNCTLHAVKRRTRRTALRSRAAATQRCPDCDKQKQERSNGYEQDYLQGLRAHVKHGSAFDPSWVNSWPLTGECDFREWTQTQL